MPPVDMTRLRKGDRVTVRKDLFDGKQYGMATAVGSMPGLRGKTVTISAQDLNSGNYKVIEDPQSWYWSKEMFVGGYDDSDIGVVTGGITGVINF